MVCRTGLAPGTGQGKDIMNSKILLSIATIAVASAGVGYGTYAFFSSTAQANDNLFTAGSLTLTLDGAAEVSGKIVATNFAPGDDKAGSILLRNEGTITTGDAQNHSVSLDLKGVVNVTDDSGVSGQPENGGVSAVPMSHYLVLTTLDYGGVDLLPLIGDQDSDGVANTLADLAAAGAIQNLSDPGAAGKTLSVVVHFAQNGPNDLKRDSTDIDFTFFLRQAGEVALQ
ncbi:MAG: TasA family protein [Candidatus Thermoplasmatota archaeon]